MIEAKVLLDAELPEGYEPPKAGGWDDYPLDELAIRDERRTAFDVIRRMQQGRFVLDPDFQRGFVWDLEKQSRLIESILMRIPLPVFYVAEDDEGRLIVVDGRQRLTTLDHFITGQLRLNLADRPELHQKRFNDLAPRMQNRVEDCQLLFYIIDRIVPERARLDIFERVNGGEVLSRQQMRNAIYNGPATVFLREEAGTDLFQQATGGSLNSRNMQDREFVNRFCAFSLLDRAKYKDMDQWLGLSLTTLKQFDKAKFTELSAKFRTALQINLEVFGKHAFRKHKSPNADRSRINASLFDVMSVILSDFNVQEARDNADKLRSAVYQLMDDDEFIRSITYGPNAPQRVRERFDIASTKILGVLNAP